MKKSGSEAAKQMWLWMREGKTNVKGYCLRTCREAWELPAQDPSAIKEWESIPANRRFKNWKQAPVGAPHFWSGGQYGHIALQSNRKGYVLSTDAPKSDLIGRVKIGWFQTFWGYKYLGWSNELQGRKLPLNKMPKGTVYATVKKGQK
jgi:hypothetical protein